MQARGIPLECRCCDKSIPAARQGLDVARTGCGIAKGLAQLVYGGVQAVVEIDEGVGGPELLLQLLAGDHVAGALQQQRQHLEGLPLQAQLDSALAQFACAEIKLKDSEARDSAAILRHVLRDILRHDAVV